MPERDRLGKQVQATLDVILGKLEANGFNARLDAQALAMLCVFSGEYNLHHKQYRYEQLQSDEWIDAIQKNEPEYMEHFKTAARGLLRYNPDAHDMPLQDTLPAYSRPATPSMQEVWEDYFSGNWD